MELEIDSYRDITAEALNRLGVFTDFDSDLEEVLTDTSLAETDEILERAYHVIKQSFVKLELKRIEQKFNELDQSGERIVADYFHNSIDGLEIVAKRTRKPGPESLTDRKKNWFFRGFCTYQEFQSFAKLHEKFIAKYGGHKSQRWKLYLEVVGGIFDNRLLIDVETKKDWLNRDVIIKSFGFRRNGRLINTNIIIYWDLVQLNKDVQRIEEQGGPETIREAKIMRMKDEHEDNWLGQLNKFYNE